MDLLNPLILIFPYKVKKAGLIRQQRIPFIKSSYRNGQRNLFIKPGD